MIPDIAKTFKRLGNRAAHRRAPRLRGETHHEEPGEHGEKVNAVDKEAESDPDFRHQEACYGGTDDPRAIEHRAVERDRIH